MPRLLAGPGRICHIPGKRALMQCWNNRGRWFWVLRDITRKEEATYLFGNWQGRKAKRTTDKRSCLGLKVGDGRGTRLAWIRWKGTEREGGKGIFQMLVRAGFSVVRKQKTLLKLQHQKKKKKNPTKKKTTQSGRTRRGLWGNRLEVHPTEGGVAGPFYFFWEAAWGKPAKKIYHILQSN